VDSSDIVILERQTCHAKDAGVASIFVYVLFIWMIAAINQFESNRRRAGFS